MHSMILGLTLAEFALLAGALLAAGAVTGILAGLFGVGGGAIIVPVLYEVFRLLGVPEEVRMVLSVGTSLAIIVPTSIRSFMAHRAKGAVDMDVLKRWAIPVVLGTIAGALLARYAPSLVFKLVFVSIASVTAFKLLFGRDHWRIAQDLPTGLPMQGYGLGIGLASALMGIGGGQIANLIMSLHGRPIHQAVATSSGLGILISIPGAIGYMVAGLGKVGLPAFSIGFVSILGFALFVPTSILTAPLGARFAHALPKRTLEIAFGLFLVAVSTRFIWNLL
jgi:uncharacterized protein